MPNPIEQYTQTCQRARAANLLVVDRGNRFLIFRKMPNRNVLVATATSVTALDKTVARCAGSTKGA